MSKFTSNRITRITAIGASLLLGSLALAGCGGGAPADPTQSSDAMTFDQLVEKAKSEGEVVGYTSIADDVNATLNEAFTKEYGIKVSTQRLIAGDFDQKVQSEFDAGQHVTDIIIGSNVEAYNIWEEQGKLAKLDPAMSSLETWPKAFRTDYQASVRMNVYGIVYNTDKITGSDVPTEWKDLLDPVFENQLLLIDPKNGTSSDTQYDLWLHDDAYGEDFLTQLGAHAQGFISGAVPAVQAVGAGSALAYAPSTPTATITGKEAGLPVDIAFPKPLTGAPVQGAVPMDAPHTYAGLLYMNFLMSPEAQEIMNSGQFSVLPDVPNTTLADDTLVVPDYARTTEDVDKIIQLLTHG